MDTTTSRRSEPSQVRRTSFSSPLRMASSALVTTLFASTLCAGQAETIEVSSYVIPDAFGSSSIDLVYDDEERLFILRPGMNAVTRITDLGEDRITEIWQGEPDAVAFDGEGYCDYDFCYNCTDTSGLSSHLHRPVTNSTSIEYSAGTLIMPRTSGPLGLYDTSLNLWFACVESTGDDPPGTAEYNVAPESDGAKGITVLTGSTSIVLGLDGLSATLGSRTGSGRGSGGSGGGGSGGGGPYPGEDEVWDCRASTSNDSLGPVVAAADIDQDGSEDLVVLHPDDDTASFLPFIGLSGTEETPGGAIFGTATTFPTMDGPQHVTSGDFNGDGFIDVVISGSGTNIQLYEGDGSGSFAPGNSIDLPGVVEALETIDNERSARDELLAGGGDETGGGWLVLAGYPTGEGTVSWERSFDGPIGAIAVDNITGADATATAACIEHGVSIVLEEIHLWGNAGNQEGMLDIPPYLDSVVDIDAGPLHCIAVDAGGRTWCWGENPDACTYEQYGVLDIATGADHSLVLFLDGTVEAHGCTNIEQDQCAIPSDLGPVAAIAGGDVNSMAIDVDGSVRIWGSNNNGQLDIPSDVTNAIQIACGFGHALALLADGSIKAWGDNTYGQSDVPSDLGTATWIAAGTYHSCAVLEDGSLRCWGRNNSGQSNVPSALGSVVQVAAGVGHTAALLEDGTVQCWGSNFLGQCDVPPNLTDVVEIRCGPLNTIAVSQTERMDSRVHVLEFSLDQEQASDLNNDGVVDGADLTILLGNWGLSGSGDLDGDGLVDGRDLAQLLGDWS